MRRVKRKIIRHFEIYLFPGRVKKQLTERKGDCLRCGKCCKLVFKCPMLRKQGSIVRCAIYKHRSSVCKLFPINGEDLKDVNNICGFSFKNSLNP